ncbi:MAG: Lrp/AsnC family transcriptional regulator [Candidatus Aenigmarchaeota archaeon]|nr:Lrp/AsnC family transcriptional regulator [Candidatus Aenigmarchaeota archaeon]
MLDKKDLEILEVVKNHAKWTTHHISKKTLIPVTTVHNRIKKMEKLGIIKGYTAILDYKKLGKAIPAFVIVDVAAGNQAKRAEEILKAVERFSEVHEAYCVTGEHDLIMRVSVEDTEKLNDFLVKVDGIRGVGKAETFIILHGEED